MNVTNYEVSQSRAFSPPHSHPNIRLRILFSNTLSLDSSLNVRDHASQPYNTPGNIIVVILIANICRLHFLVLFLLTLLVLDETLGAYHKYSKEGKKKKKSEESKAAKNKYEGTAKQHKR